MRLFFIALVGILLSGCTCSSKYKTQNVLIMSEKNSDSSQHGNNKSTRLVTNSLVNQLNTAGFNVYDETVVTLDDFNMNFDSYNRRDLIEIARNIQSVDIDYLVLLNIDEVIKQSPYTQHVSSEVYATTLALDSGKVLNTSQITSRKIPAPTSCLSNCINEKVRDSLKGISGELAYKIINALPQEQCAVKSKNTPILATNNFSIVFDGFNGNEYSLIEDHLMQLSEFKGLRLVESSLTNTEIMYSYAKNKSHLMRAIRAGLTRMNLPNQIRFFSDRIVVTKISLRNSHSEVGVLKNINDW